MQITHNCNSANFLSSRSGSGSSRLASRPPPPPPPPPLHDTGVHFCHGLTTPPSLSSSLPSLLHSSLQARYSKDAPAPVAEGCPLFSFDAPYSAPSLPSPHADWPAYLDFFSISLDSRQLRELESHRQNSCIAARHCGRRTGASDAAFRRRRWHAMKEQFFAFSGVAATCKIWHIST